MAFGHEPDDDGWFLDEYIINSHASANSVAAPIVPPGTTPAPVSLVEPASASTPDVKYSVQVSGGLEYTQGGDYQRDKVTTTDKGQIIIYMPRLYKQMRTAVISYWHHEEETAFRQSTKDFWWNEKRQAEYAAPITIIKPGDYLLRVETKPAYFDIPLPPWIDFPCRIVAVLKRKGERVRVGDKLIVLRQSEGV